MEDLNESQASTTVEVTALTAVVQALKILPPESHVALSMLRWCCSAILLNE